MSAQRLGELLGFGTQPGEGMLWRLDHAWPMPAWLTVLMVFGVCAGVVWLYWREGDHISRRVRLLLAALRLAAFAVLCLMASQLSLLTYRTGLPRLVLLLDDSASMSVMDGYPSVEEARLRRAIPDLPEDPSRFEIVRRLLLADDAGLLRDLAEDYRLQVGNVQGDALAEGEDLAGLRDTVETLQAVRDQSPLGEAVRATLERLRGTLPAAVVFVTDGNNTRGPDLDSAARMAQRKGVPLYFVAVGDDRAPMDVGLSGLLADDHVFLGDVVSFEVQLTATGLTGEKLHLWLHEEGSDAVLAEVEEVAPPDGETATVRLYYRPTREGTQRFVVESTPLADESRTDNNRLPATVEVHDEQLRVLLVQAAPSFEFRYLRNVLMREPSIDLECVLQEADPQYSEIAAGARPGFPLSRDELFGYDAIILGDVDPSLLPPKGIDDIAAFVESSDKGGTLICIAGPRFMPLAFRDSALADVLPIDAATVRLPASGEPISAGYRMVPTDLGAACSAFQIGSDARQSELLWRSLPEMYWLAEIGSVKPGARVLARHPTRRNAENEPLPLVVMHYLGAGKVLFHATDATWRWRYRTGDVLFTRYWVQMLRFLCRNQLGDGGIVLRSDRREYQFGEDVRLSVEFADPRSAPRGEDVVVALDHQRGKRRHVTLNRAALGPTQFMATVDELPVGRYHAWLASPALRDDVPSTDFVVEPPAAEFDRVQTQTPAMRRAAEWTGGACYRPYEMEQLFDDLPPGTQVPLEALPPIPLWNRWQVLLCLIALLAAEWGLRKWRGMT